MSPLAELFPDSDYRFHLTLRRGPPEDFFRPWDGSGRLLAERARWLDSDPARYAALGPGQESVLADFAAMAQGWRGCLPGKRPNERNLDQSNRSSATTVVGLGARIEPDFVLLVADEAGAFRVQGGAVCFPSGWALAEKMGHTLDFVHGVVPGLNPAMGAPIQRLLTNLTPGIAFMRSNWGLAAHDELNSHPARRLPVPALPVSLARLWLRVEHQALVALPRSRGVVFGIRIALFRMDEVGRDDGVAAGLHRALASMPEAMAEYKGLKAIRPALLDLLQ